MAGYSIVVGLPHPIVVEQDGVCAEFFSGEMNELRVSLSDISSMELESYFGKITVGLISGGGRIIVCFEWGEGEGAVQSACSVNVLLWPDRTKVERFVDNAVPTERFLVNQILVERNGNITKQIRTFTLPPELTAPICEAVKDQLSGRYTVDQITEANMSTIYAHNNDKDVIVCNQVDMFEIGR